jgi:magnesium transporter
MEKTQQVLAQMSGDEAREVRELLKFEENSAGGMMTTEMVIVGEEATRGEVVEWIRQNEVNRDQLDTVFLLDGDAHLSGAVPVARLWLCEDRQRLAELKMEPLVYVQPDAEDSEVFALFDKYNLRSLAVVNEHTHPVGMITVDDVVTRLREKA